MFHILPKSRRWYHTRLHSCSLRSVQFAACLISISAILVGCARLSVSPQSAQRPDPAASLHAIESERFVPAWIVVNDFTFSPLSVSENSSPVYRAKELLLSNSEEDPRVKIARDAAASLSDQTIRRLDKVGLTAIRIRADSEAKMPGNNLVVTGRLINVDEGNRLTRIAFGLGAGEASLDTQVHVFRVAQGEWAEVLAFSTHADSGKLPGMAESVGFGFLFIGPITMLSSISDAASAGQKIYSTQMDVLAAQTGDQIARYLSQYSADQGWIPPSRAKSVNLATD